MMTKHTFTFYKGVDDLLSEYAFRGNSQGDRTVTNNLQEYKDAEGWLSYVFDDKGVLNQDSINKESDRRKKLNKEYIEKLQDEGKFKEPYTIELEVEDNPHFDNNTFNFQPLSSYSMWVEDLTK